MPQLIQRNEHFRRTETCSLSHNELPGNIKKKAINQLQVHLASKDRSGLEATVADGPEPGA